MKGEQTDPQPRQTGDSERDSPGQAKRRGGRQHGTRDLRTKRPALQLVERVS
jgi:hypothetical protein